MARARVSPKGMTAFARELVLYTRDNPPEEVDNLRNVMFYRNLGKIHRWLEAQGIDANEYDATHKKPFATAFYQTISKVLSKMVLDGELTYAELNIQESERFKDEAEDPDHKIGLFVEKQGEFNTFKPLKSGLNISLWSMRGFESTSALEQIMERLRRQPLSTLYVLSDWDPSGVCLAEDLGRRARKLGIKTKFVRIGVKPEDIPEERRTMSLVRIKTKDSRAKDFVRRYGKQAYEIEAIGEPSERRAFVLRKLMEYGVDVDVSVQKRHKEDQAYLSRYVTEQLLYTLKRKIRRSALEKIVQRDTRRPTVEQLMESIIHNTQFLEDPLELVRQIAEEVKRQFGISDEDLEDE